MDWIALGNPVPREEPRPYDPIAWLEGERFALPVASALGAVDLGKCLNDRRTRRSMGGVSLTQLSALLWATARIQQADASALGFPLTFRPCPSAGSIHPIHILVQQDGNSTLLRYDAAGHALVSIGVAQSIATGLRAASRELVDADGALLTFAAEPGKTFAKYAQASSLIWRDAGVLLGYLSVAAEALGLNFVPLGITGEPWVDRLDEKGRLVGVGMAVVGSR